MDVSRRAFIRGATAAGAAGLGLNATGATGAEAEQTSGRKRRTIYFNDARHYYLFVFEPPMTMEDAWLPIDECAGTTIDTFVYGVARNDGLFYPSRVGLRFGEDIRPFSSSAYYRVWENMQSLIDRGLDPLTVLIDRAHDKGMDFFASLRMAGHATMDPKHRLAEGGRALAHPEVRDHQFAVIKELVNDYETEGVELDFAASPGGMPKFLRKEDVKEYTPVMTEFVRKITEMARRRSGRPAQIGARVYPTEEMCLAEGLDVRTWLKEGIVDFIVPMLYIDFNLDIDMPIEGLVDLAHKRDISVYGMLQPYPQYPATGSITRHSGTPETMRAAAANFYAKGVDGVYTWFMKWPLQDAERRTLAEIGDPDLIKEGDKLYIKRRRSGNAVDMGYDAALPIEIETADPSKTYKLPFMIADDVQESSDRVRRVTLMLHVRNLVSADRFSVRLNGQSLEHETCRRSFGNHTSPYDAMRLEFELEGVRPRKGENELELSLEKRPKGFVGGVTIENLEVLVEYGVYPTTGIG